MNTTCAAIVFALSVCFSGRRDRRPLRFNKGMRFATIMFVRGVCFFRGVEDVAPYGLITECGSPPYCLFSPFVSYGRFNISLRFMAHLLRKYVIAPTVRWCAAVYFALAVCFQAGDHWSPLQKQQDLIVACRGDSRIARDVVRTTFRLQQMFALIKSLPQWGKVAAEG